MQYLTVLYACGVIAILGAYFLIVNRSRLYARQRPAKRPGLMLGALSALAIICTALFYQLSVRSLHPEAAARVAPAGNQQIKTRPSVILIVLDAVRTHCLSLYDNHGLPATHTRALEAFSHDALLFKNCIANSPWTLPSHASLFTGLHPREHGCHGNLQAANSWFGGFPTPRPLADAFLTMAEVFAGNGYRTGAVVANSACLDKGWNINQGFHTYDCRSNVGMIYMTYPLRPIVHLFCYLINLDSRFILPYRAAADITSQSLRQIDGFAQDPFFLFINYMDAHDPYCPPAPYDGYFLSAAWTQLHKLQQLLLHYAGRLPRESWYRYLLTQYNGGIAYLDDELGRLLEQLRQKGLYDSSMIIITSDHGELFDEHGLRGHMVPMYEGVMRVPLLIKFPFSQEQGTSEGLIMLSDVYATTLSACGLPMPETVAAKPFGNGTRAVGEFENYTIGIHRALYEGAYKYMHYERQQSPELYDLERDPMEKNNLAAARPDVVLAMQEKLREWEVTFPPQYTDSPKPAGTVSRQVLENLKALGYIK